MRVFTGHLGSVKAVAVSPNGRLMASAGKQDEDTKFCKTHTTIMIGEDKSIILWDLGSGRRLKRMTGHTGFIYSVDFSADGNVLVSGGADGTVRVWDVNKDTPSAMQTFEDDGNAEGETKRIRLETKDRKDSKEKLKIEEKRKKGIFER